MSTSRKKVLIVDDDEMIRAILSDAFLMEQCDVLCAGSGVEAAAILTTEAVDAVLSDIRMANGTGLELLEHIKKQNYGATPVYLMTAFADSRREEVQSKGGETIISKPFDIFNIVRSVLTKSKIR